MANKKVESGHIVVAGNGTNVGADSENTTALDDLKESSEIYQTGMAPLAAQQGENENGASSEIGGTAVNASENNSDSKYTNHTETDADGQNMSTEDEHSALCTVVLKKAATFRSHGAVYEKDVPIPVKQETAERLIKTGLFERR